MPEFKLHDQTTAPEAALPFFESAQNLFGFVPNVLRIQAGAPALLEGYMTLSKIFSTTSFSPAEQQIILMCVSYANNCTYCMAAHTGGAMKSGADDKAIESIRAGTPVADSRLEALCGFVKTVVDKSGFVPPEEIDAFLAAGFTQQNVLEVILGIAVKTMTHYANHMADTPLDAQLSPLAWEKPAA